jgi:hypothetical protein
VLPVASHRFASLTRYQSVDQIPSLTEFKKLKILIQHKTINKEDMENTL